MALETWSSETECHGSTYRCTLELRRFSSERDSLESARSGCATFSFLLPTQPRGEDRELWYDRARRWNLDVRHRISGSLHRIKMAYDRIISLICRLTRGAGVKWSQYRLSSVVLFGVMLGWLILWLIRLPLRENEAVALLFSRSSNFNRIFAPLWCLPTFPVWF